MDYTGTGNTLNMTHPRTLQLLMDSLRYWVQEMHVDGFRFDLASALARELDEVDRLGAFFDTIQQDPTISQVKLIAEPWDLGEGGYQVGNFPELWRMERRVPRHGARLLEGRRGPGGLRGLPADRLERPVRRWRPAALRERQFRHRARRLHAGDLVSYDQKHNGPTARRTTTAPTTTSPGIAAPRDDRRPGDQGAAGPPAAQPVRVAAALAGRADDRRRR